MAEKTNFPAYLSRRARFEATQKSPISGIGGALPVGAIDLSETQPRRAKVAGLDSSWPCSLPLAPYEPDCRGTVEARKALARFLSRRVETKEQELLLTASTSEAYSFLLLALCDPGDAVLVPRPGYPLLEDIAQLCGVKLVEYRIAYDGTWYIDSSTLPTRAKIEQERIRFALVVSPHNPTGHVMSQIEFAQLGQLGIPLVVDEVFQPFVLYPSDRDAEPLDNPGRCPLTLVLSGLSKLVGAPGLKLAWICAKGQEAETFLESLEFVSDAYLSVNQLVQDELPTILSQAQPYARTVRAHLLHSDRFIDGACKNQPITALPLRAGMSKIIQLPDILTERQWCDRFLAQGVVLQSGSLYSLPLRNSVLVSLLTAHCALERGMEVIKSVVNSAVT